MRRHLPNQLTMLRLVLAAVFFLVLNQYRYAGPHEDRQIAVLLISTALFIIAAVTDALDGYLARRWKVESAFGRIMDPVCDKVLVLGAFIYLTGSRFTIPVEVLESHQVNMISGVYPWMVVVMLLRELMVTSVRSHIEGEGMKFGAKMFGKLKMILQSITVPVVLVLLCFDPHQQAWAAWTRDILVYVTVAITFISGLPYVSGARKALSIDKAMDRG